MKINIEDLPFSEGIEIKIGQGYTVKVSRSVNGLTSEVVDSVELRHPDGRVHSYDTLTTPVSEDELLRVCGGIVK